jgi:hypothetical protein
MNTNSRVVTSLWNPNVKAQRSPFISVMATLLAIRLIGNPTLVRSDVGITQAPFNVSFPIGAFFKFMVIKQSLHYYNDSCTTNTKSGWLIDRTLCMNMETDQKGQELT